MNNLSSTDRRGSGTHDVKSPVVRAELLVHCVTKRKAVLPFVPGKREPKFPLLRFLFRAPDQMQGPMYTLGVAVRHRQISPPWQSHPGQQATGRLTGKDADFHNTEDRKGGESKSVLPRA